MERLTPKDLHPREVKNFVDKFNDKGDDPYFRSKIIDKLWEYEEAEEQRLFVRLSCKVGDKVYYLVATSHRSGFILPQEILYFEVYGEVWRAMCMNGHFTSSDINKTVFFTEAEALQALKERENQ